MKRIILTGGGSAGHVTPNLALVPKLKEENFDVHYIGSYKGIEGDLIGDTDIPYHKIASGKLRRYFSWRNFVDPFKIFWGIIQAFIILGKVKPNIVFSKGGFVSVPVVRAAHTLHIPCIIPCSHFHPQLFLPHSLQSYIFFSIKRPLHHRANYWSNTVLVYKTSLTNYELSSTIEST
jgi:UDP-N-acetylglucosamine--N-acetylmuramyl-(pentapeptide) pyrophosphoryl-undecaprenol N-acetylglucosamine transferase